jgi:exonuclease SbcC
MSASPALQTISISNFRSIRGTVAIPLNAPIVLLHGLNGAGKSTVMSAIEVALTGTVAELDRADRTHLLHRGTDAGEIELSTLNGTARFEIDASSIRGTPVLSGEDARYFVERCYLAQRTLGQLLEIYQSAENQRESPLTRFVKDLLRLDELDAFIEGTDAVRDKRLIKGLVPDYAEAERKADDTRRRIRQSTVELERVTSQVAEVQSRLAPVLEELAAPFSAGDVPEIAAAVESWLASAPETEQLISLIAARQELAALRIRWHQVAQTDSAREQASAMTIGHASREAVTNWWQAYGVTLNRVLDLARIDLPEISSASPSSDPAPIHSAAREAVSTEVGRLQALLAADEAARANMARLDDAVVEAQRRLATLDSELASSATATTAEELGRVLAALVPHVHGDDCPVCGRDYGETSDTPLSAHLAMRISALGKEAERLQNLAAARLEALTDIRTTETTRKELTPIRFDPSETLETQDRVTRLESLLARLDELAQHIAVGAKLTREAHDAERELAAAQERDRTSNEVRSSLGTHAKSLGIEVDPDEPIEDAIERLNLYTDSRIATIEQWNKLRAVGVELLKDIGDLERDRRRLETTVGQLKEELSRTTGAIKGLERYRDLIKSTRSRAEVARVRIVRRVFNESLNRVWRDLFVRLAPDEPFVPAFHVPGFPGEGVTANLETIHRDGTSGGSPAAMLSAGNLNTAALTLFLALHLSAGERLPYLLLDDPVQSMDEVHVSQFAALLRTLSKRLGRRIVIAVHERSLFDYLALELSPAQMGDSLVTVALSRSASGATIADPVFHTYEEDTALSGA